MNADVLWISDFKIPLSVPELTDQMLEYRKVDTHFYGLHLELRRMNGCLSSIVYIGSIILLPAVTDSFWRIRFICLNCCRNRGSCCSIV